MQTGNANPLIKVHPKKSFEIKFNRLGTTAPRMPRTASNDYLPLEPIHLIDGDNSTCWSSKTMPQADVEPAWIRIDIPVEKRISSIILHKRKPGPPRNKTNPDKGANEVGMGMPGHLTIKISCDSKNWETLFDGRSNDKPEIDEFSLQFDSCPAKQIWIIGTNLPRVENWLHSFTIAEVEIRDNYGHNLALVSRGTGVTVSSTQHSIGQTRDEHRWLWPIHADLGLKWVRVGYHNDPINWHWVEKEKGKLEVDPEADSAISYLVQHGINVDFSLGFGNRLYTQADPARKLPKFIISTSCSRPAFLKTDANCVVSPRLIDPLRITPGFRGVGFLSIRSTGRPETSLPITAPTFFRGAMLLDFPVVSSCHGRFLLLLPEELKWDDNKTSGILASIPAAAACFKNFLRFDILPKVIYCY
jgi:hypothetical protein